MELNFEKLLKMVKKQWVLMVSVILLFSLAAFLFSAFIMSPVYTCEMKFRVNVSNAGMLNLTDSARLVTLVADVIERIKSDAFYNLVSANTEARFSAGDVEGRVKFTLVEESTVFWMSVSASTSEEAYLLGQAVERSAPEHIRNNGEIYAIQNLVYAKAPQSPSGPNVTKNTAVGFVMGAVTAMAIVIAIEFLDRRVKNSADLSERFELQILGVVPYFGVSGKKVKE